MHNDVSKQHKLAELIAYFETCNRAEGKSPKTISWYSENLRRFQRYIDSRHMPDSLASLDIKLLREYVLYLLKRVRYENHPYTPAKAEPLSALTIHAHVRTLRAFFSWLAREGVTDSNIAKDLKPPKVPKKVISTLSDEEIRAILNQFNPKNPIDVRNQAIFMLLLDAGLRIGEAVNLKMGDVHGDEGFFKVLGKGSKERLVPFGSVAQKSLHRYIFLFRPVPATMALENVFLNTSGRPITENSLKLMFSRLSRLTGISRLHAHLCRHTFATRFLINGGDVFSLQQILGHTTLEMVKHYVNLASSHVVMQHSKYSPLDHMDLHRA